MAMERCAYNSISNKRSESEKEIDLLEKEIQIQFYKECLKLFQSKFVNPFELDINWIC